MLRRHLYLKITAIVVASLFLFSLIASLLWGAVGYDDYGDALYVKSAGLAERLLPAVDAGDDAHFEAVNAVSDLMDYEITVYNSKLELIASSGPPAPLGSVPLETGTWNGDSGRTRWTTRLTDGRIAIIVLNRRPLPDETISFTIFLLVLALIVSIMMYPVARSVTKRLERLKASVERIGAGALGERVIIEGSDEVAAVALSFNKAADQLERLVESQRLLLAHTSHELRTPLARIRMGIELLKENNDPARQEALQDDISELDALIEEVLLLARLDEPNQLVEMDPLDLVGLCAVECARYPEVSFTASDAQIILGNARMLQHLLRNLVDNAIKHGKTPVDVEIQQNEAEVWLSVADDGPGIPEGRRGEIFEAFFRGKDRQNVPGFGLGLALVKRIADSHSATIDISSYPVSTVRVRFPRLDNDMK